MNKLVVFVLAVIAVVLVPLVQRGLDESWKRLVFADASDTTTIQFIIFLDGVGNSGDGTNPDSIGSNKDPDLYTKQLKITFYGQSGRQAQATPVLTKTENLRFDYAKGAYIGDVELGNELPSGDYGIKVKVDGYLQRSFPLRRIDQGTSIVYPAVNLVAGDLNGNNRLDIIDYHILIGCYSDVLPPAFCYPQSLEILADLSNDGKVNQKDYNLFMREAKVYQKGE